MLGRGGPTIDYGASLEEFKKSEFAAWKGVHIKLNDAYTALKDKLKAVADSGSDADSLKECLEKAKNKISEDIKEKTAYFGDVIGLTEKPSVSTVAFSPSLNFISPSASCTSISLTGWEFSFCGLFGAASAEQLGYTSVDVDAYVFNSSFDVVKAIISGGKCGAKVKKSEAEMARMKNAAKKKKAAALAAHVGMKMRI